MFKVNDTVFVRATNAPATIVYAEEGYVVVQLRNGVEQDFSDTAQLMSKNEYDTLAKQRADQSAHDDKIRNVDSVMATLEVKFPAVARLFYEHLTTDEIFAIFMHSDPSGHVLDSLKSPNFFEDAGCCVQDVVIATCVWNKLFNEMAKNDQTLFMLFYKNDVDQLVRLADVFLDYSNKTYVQPQLALNIKFVLSLIK